MNTYQTEIKEEAEGIFSFPGILRVDDLHFSVYIYINIVTIVCVCVCI